MRPGFTPVRGWLTAGGQCVSTFYGLEHVGESSFSPISNPPWTAKRHKLLTWLEENARSLSELYRGAVVMVFGGSFPGRGRFVPHAIREICNSLPGVLAGMSDRKRVDYVGRLDVISATWRTLPPHLFPWRALPASDVGLAGLGSLTLPGELVQHLDTLVCEHDAGRERPMENAKRLFDALVPRTALDDRGRLDALVRQWVGLGRQAAARAHDGGKADQDYEDRELLQMLESLENTLAALIRGFFETADELDEILEDTNS